MHLYCRLVFDELSAVILELLISAAINTVFCVTRSPVTEVTYFLKTEKDNI